MALRGASAATLTVVALLAVGCSREPARSPIPVTLPLRTFALNLDPLTLADVDSRKVATLIYAGLVAVDQDGRIEARAASSWRRLDANTWAFELKPGLTFANGAPATADKVVRSLCASMQPASTQAWSLDSIDHQASSNGKAVRCTGLSADQGRVIIRENRPSPWLMEGLAGPGGWITDPDAKPGPYGVRPGLGPYVIRKVEQDQSVQLDARPGGALAARAAKVAFRYLPDAATAAAAFNGGQLDVLEVDAPDAAALVLAGPEKPSREDARVLRVATDRVRVVTFNVGRLKKRGLSDAQVTGLAQAYGRALDRPGIVKRSAGLASPLSGAFPPAAAAGGRVGVTPALTGPALRLITENDAYSEQIAAALPPRIGGAPVTYTGLEKGLFLSSLFKGDYDLALLKIEATHHTPRFWTAFFTPGNPYTAFGRPLPALEGLDVATPEGLASAARHIAENGNWVGVVREVGVIALANRIDGVRVTASGQLSLEGVGLR